VALVVTLSSFRPNSLITGIPVIFRPASNIQNKTQINIAVTTGILSIYAMDKCSGLPVERFSAHPPAFTF
jgi:hypothetical protein